MVTDNDPDKIELTGQLKWVERIAAVMDNKFRVPGTNFRFGLDPVMNLVPFAGDISGFMVAAALLYIMAKNGVSRKVLILMSINVCIDTVLGAIPLVGQVTDFYFKANTRNIKLLKEHYQHGRHTGHGKGIIAVLFIILLFFMVAAVYISYKAFQWLFMQF